ncbi:DUF1996 domain-containing protein [Streptomyces sp. NBC_00328]|uniref:DUF1996 domain-containing protein n=1 Tax=Streptomyces sp. NBC_00328 TaxID=2903646 RepID=UPI002E285736|nr:DUF1996 domain-containing protein [Streptomyces sp. NBC_00328]
MGRNTRRRPTGARRATSAAFALILGGGGLVGVNVYASASETGATDANVLSAGSATIDCPDVGEQLKTVPDAAKEGVDKELADLDQQIAEAYRQLQAKADQMQQNGDSGADAIMNPLKEKRSESIGRIVAAIDAVGDPPSGLDGFAACTLRPSGNQPGTGADTGQSAAPQDQNSASPSPGASQNQGGQQGGAAPAGNGPVAADYADIKSVQPNVANPQPQGDASQGEFVSSCGVNANGLFNSDNVIVAPGVTNGAHHFHDYIGNQSNTAFASDDDLAKADTSCQDKGDKSSYFWPVVRLQNGTQERDAGSPGGGTEGNAGKIVTPKQVTLTFVGNPRSKVTEMPRLLRIITGDAKAFVNGPANANASWSCTGFEDRQLKDKYPLCPQGSDVVRTFKFQSCWDGANIDSANHRTHVAFADAQGNCPGNFKAIPQLVQRIVYDIDAPSLQDGGRTSPLFAVDSFPENLHKPVTDHGDFINVFDEDTMKNVVDCINSGKKCGAGAGDGGGQQEDPPATDEPSQSAEPNPSEAAPNPSEADPNPSEQPAENPSEAAPNPSEADPNPSEEPAENPSEDPAPTAHDPSDGKGEQGSGDNGGGQAEEPTEEAPATEPAGNDAPPATVEPKSDVTAPGDDQGAEVGTPAQTEPAAASYPPATSGIEPQAVGTGGLAETGANLWPGVIGGIFVLSGIFVLYRIRRTYA